MIRLRRRKWWIASGFLAAAALAVVYYTGDQRGRVAESGLFTIDTTDPDSITKAISTSADETSGSFAIDTRDPDSVTLARALATSEESTGGFTIDTRDPDAVVLARSLSVAKTSANFAIDTQATGPTYTIWGDFTIDTRDPDSVAYAISQAVAEVSSTFVIDTTEPPPEDSDNDHLHDLWERLYFGSVFSSGPDDDPDRDGQSNFEEFATGTDPTKAGAPAHVEFWIEENPSGATLYLRYWRHILATRMVNYEILMSDGLKSWIDASQNFTETGEVLNGNGYAERVTLSYPLLGTPPPRQFVRLKLSPIIP